MIFDYLSNKNSLPFTQSVVQSFATELQWSANLTIGFIFRGEVTVHYEMHQREFQEHDFMFFLPMQTYTVVSATPEARILLFHMDTQYIKQLCPDFSNVQLSQNHLNADLSNEIYVSICHDLAMIIFNNLKKETTTQMQMLIAATHMVSTLISNFGIISEKSTRRLSEEADRNIEILRYIDENYSSPFSVSDIASHLGLHPQYFSSYFKKQFQTNFIDYLNQYRVNRSIYDIIYTSESIINIALKYGFNSHKTYSMAFKKIYQHSPMEYRKIITNPAEIASSPTETSQQVDENSSGLFGYFRQFLSNDVSQSNTADILRQAKHQQDLRLEVDSYFSESKNFDNYIIISVGRAFSVLRSEVQSQIRLAKNEIDFEFLRIRDIFSDDLYVCYENESKEIHYSWYSLDAVFDFILSLGVKPFPELGYMPESLASKKQYAGVHYRPNVSAPKDYQSWGHLIYSFLMHCVERYGLSEVETWFFDFWTSPDLQTKNAYWNESQEEFFNFYKCTYDAFQKVSPKLRLGSPNFSTLSGLPWYESFFQFCFANRIYPAFVDFHVYNTKPVGNRDEDDSFLEIHSENYSVSNPDYISTQIDMIHQIMNRSGFRTLDVIVSDWNLSFLPKDPIRDTCYMGPFICHTITRNLPKAKSLCFWTLSDIHEDAFPESKLFSGGPGMLDYHGLKKASYNTLQLLTKLGNRILKIGDNYIFTQSGSRYQLLIYNLAEFDAMFSLIDQSAMDDEHRYQIYNEHDLSVNIVIDLPKGTYLVKRSEVNRSYGSAYDLWNSIGAPQVLQKELEDYIRTNSVPRVTFSVEHNEQVLFLHEDIPAHGVVLLEIAKQDNLALFDR